MFTKQEQIYMIAARACIVDGAVTLDGGIITEDGSVFKYMYYDWVLIIKV